MSGTVNEYSDFLSAKKALTEFKRNYGYTDLSSDSLKTVIKDFLNVDNRPTIENRTYVLRKIFNFLRESRIIDFDITF